MNKGRIKLFRARPAKPTATWALVLLSLLPFVPGVKGGEKLGQRGGGKIDHSR